MGISAPKEKSYEIMRSQTDQIRYEFGNHDSIVLRKSGLFYKAIGSSAVILKELGIETKIRSGYDPVSNQELLEMSIHMGNIGKVKEFLLEKCGSVLRYDEDFFIIRLKQPMDSKKLKQLKKSAELKSEVAEDILTKRRNETPLAKEARDVLMEVSLLVRPMSGIVGEVLGRRFLEASLDLCQAIRVLMRDEKSDERRLAVNDAADDLQGLLLVTPNFDEYADRLAKIGRSLNKITTRKRAAIPRNKPENDTEASG